MSQPDFMKNLHDERHTNFLKRLDAFLESEGMEMRAWRQGELVFEPKGGSYGFWVKQNLDGPYKPLAEGLKK